MAKTLKVKIITLNEVVMEKEDVKRFTSKAVNSSLEILNNHAPIIVSTVPCKTIIEGNDGSKVELFTSKGVVNVKDNELVFCCDAAELAGDIDLDRALKSKERAEERLKDYSKYDVQRAKLALSRALARIDLKEHSK
ncbi:F0F1 ATP synthase subunit epsilon [Clostridium sp. SHJSY1]|uniref:ATP synthase delta/epsilon chain alpha-helix domain-containing protein n=1 Tax=Clostridium sp. SHJSY1 TaxID=2942483 RepID=UPI0028757F71|nr:ATP synthase delta/epsilon chain alpha-helix domain-containing protein [Clostridium sp. SHJSY1]MDS0528334.1 F0F1 ATP synthase subunit epsilon [Clostridium sp. SHJSY1]